jgi:hypothetical protein
MSQIIVEIKESNVFLVPALEKNIKDIGNLPSQNISKLAVIGKNVDLETLTLLANLSKNPEAIEMLKQYAPML